MYEVNGARMDWTELDVDTEPMAVLCEHGNKPTDFLESSEFL
jgi:hypothetical protein